MTNHCKDCKFYKIQVVDRRSYICIRKCYVGTESSAYPGKKFVRVLANTDDGCEKFQPKVSTEEMRHGQDSF